MADRNNLAALTPKVLANGASPQTILQPGEQVAFRADATDAATTQALANGLKANMIALGLMRSS